MVLLDANMSVVFKGFLLNDSFARKFMPGKNDSENERPSIFFLWQIMSRSR